MLGIIEDIKDGMLLMECHGLDFMNGPLCDVKDIMLRVFRI